MVLLWWKCLPGLLHCGFHDQQTCNMPIHAGVIALPWTTEFENRWISVEHRGTCGSGSGTTNFIHHVSTLPLALFITSPGLLLGMKTIEIDHGPTFRVWKKLTSSPPRFHNFEKFPFHWPIITLNLPANLRTATDLKIHKDPVARIDQSSIDLFTFFRMVQNNIFWLDAYGYLSPKSRI